MGTGHLNLNGTCFLSGSNPGPTVLPVEGHQNALNSPCVSMLTCHGGSMSKLHIQPFHGGVFIIYLNGEGKHSSQEEKGFLWCHSMTPALGLGSVTVPESGGDLCGHCSVSAHASDLRRTALESHIHGRCSHPTPNSGQGFRDMGSF